MEETSEELPNFFLSALIQQATKIKPKKTCADPCRRSVTKEFARAFSCA